MFCNHFFDDADEKALPKCKAFPEGIPHDTMWETDEKECNNGIKFEE